MKQTNGKSCGVHCGTRSHGEHAWRCVVDRLIAGSFRESLHWWIRERLNPFADLPYDQYKRRAEVTDQDAREQKIGPYAKKADPKPVASSRRI